MSGLEIFQNGTSLHPDRMGEPVYQIGRKNADGEYDVVVFDGMTHKEAKARLEELQPAKVIPKQKPVQKTQPVVEKKVVTKKKLPAKKKPSNKEVAKKKLVKKKATKKRW